MLGTHLTVITLVKNVVTVISVQEATHMRVSANEMNVHRSAFLFKGSTSL